MAILSGFPPGNTLMCGGFSYRPQEDFVFRIKEEKPLLSNTASLVEAEPNDSAFSCTKFSKLLNKQYERVRAALVVYTTDVLEQLQIEPTPEIMETCLAVGEAMYDLYSFDEHGPYTEYIEGHLRRTILERDYPLKAMSRRYFD